MNLRNIGRTAILAALAAGLGASAEAATVTVKTQSGVMTITGKVIVRSGGQGRIPITISGEKLHQFYLHESRVQKIETTDGTANIVSVDTSIYPEKSEMTQAVDRYLKGLEVQLVSQPEDGWVKVKGLKGVEGWIRADRLANVVSFVEGETPSAAIPPAPAAGTAAETAPPATEAPAAPATDATADAAEPATAPVDVVSPTQ